MIESAEQARWRLRMAWAELVRETQPLPIAEVWTVDRLRAVVIGPPEPTIAAAIILSAAEHAHRLLFTFDSYGTTSKRMAVRGTLERRFLRRDPKVHETLVVVVSDKGSAPLFTSYPYRRHPEGIVWMDGVSASPTGNSADVLSHYAFPEPGGLSWDEAGAIAAKVDDAEVYLSR